MRRGVRGIAVVVTMTSIVAACAASAPSSPAPPAPALPSTIQTPARPPPPVPVAPGPAADASTASADPARAPAVTVIDLDASTTDASTASTFAFDATVPTGRKLRVWGLGRATCDPAPALRRLVPLDAGSKCTIVKVTGARASATDKTTRAAAAFDGDACTSWNAGGSPPQAVEAQLSAVASLDAIVLVPEMTPAKGQTVHVIELAAGDRVVRRLVVDAPLATNEAFMVLLDGPMRADRVRVVTTTSPSWVAWREIALVDCGGGPVNVARGVREVTPAPARRIEVGKGACKTDADCAPDACCGARTCNARSMAPRCEGVGCGQGCGGDDMSCGRGSCVCESGTCAAWYHGVIHGQQ